MEFSKKGLVFSQLFQVRCVGVFFEVIAQAPRCQRVCPEGAKDQRMTPLINRGDKRPWNECFVIYLKGLGHAILGNFVQFC